MSVIHTGQASARPIWQHSLLLWLRVERYSEQLFTLATYGKMWIVPGPPPTHLVGTQTMNVRDLIEQVIAYCGQGVMITLESRLVKELHMQLNAWKQVK